MTETTDGFEIAERDLRLRGPGDFFGTRQAGMPTLPRWSISCAIASCSSAAQREARALVRATAPTPATRSTRCVASVGSSGSG